MTANARRVLRLVLGISACLVVTAVAVASPRGMSSLPDIPPLPSAGEATVTHSSAGIAIDGFDPVAYFAEGRAVSGLPGHEWQHRGVVWRFASAANRAAFQAAPDSFLPAFGGHDPVAVARGRAVLSHPGHFLIVDGRLLLFRSPETREQARRDHAVLAKADHAWPELASQLTR